MKGRIVVIPDAPEEKTASGLFIPDAAKPVPSSGKVTHVSDGEDIFKVGDHVLFTKNAGVELNMEPVHILMRVEDIYATV